MTESSLTCPHIVMICCAVVGFLIIVTALLIFIIRRKQKKTIKDCKLYIQHLNKHELNLSAF